MTEFDISRNPLSSSFGPTPKSDDLVTTKIVLNVRHYPTEEYIIREAVNDCYRASYELITNIFTKYGINRPKDKLI